MSRISSEFLRGFSARDDDFGAGGSSAEARSRRSNRRRVVVFLSVFAAVALVGLGWVFSRPAIYQATAQLKFVSASAQPGDDPASTAPAPPSPAANGTTYSIRDEVQYLTSRKLLAKVWDDLKDLAVTPASLKTADPPATLQTMLAATQLPGSSIVSIEAKGRDAAFLAAFVDLVISDYQAGLDDRFKDSSTTDLADTRTEERALAASLADKRGKLDTFRQKYNIVSLNSDENQVLAEAKGIAASLNLANDKAVAAEGRLAALRDAQAQGRSVVRARDNPTLASLEQQASALRGELRATARQFTEEYMAMDPRVRASRARLSDLDEQIAVVRKESQAGAIQEAQEEVAAARGAAAALRQQLAANQNGVQSFTSHLGEYRALEQEVTRLTLMQQMAGARAESLEAGERARKPKVEIVEPPSVPQSPFSPNYPRDAALAVFSAVFVGLLTMGIVELFNRPPHQAATVVVPQPWAPIGLVQPVAPALPTAAYATLPDAAAGAAALPAPLPRELTASELAALLGAADPELRALIALLLTGLTDEEIVDLRRGDVARDVGEITVAGRNARTVRVPAEVVAALPAASQPADAPLLTTVGGRPFAVADVETSLLYAAHDAGIDGADSVTPETLRHTYIAFLVRQGARFSELARLVGALPADRLSGYRRMAPVASAGEIDRVLPAVRAISS